MSNTQKITIAGRDFSLTKDERTGYWRVRRRVKHDVNIDRSTHIRDLAEARPAQAVRDSRQYASLCSRHYTANADIEWCCTDLVTPPLSLPHRPTFNLHLVHQDAD